MLGHGVYWFRPLGILRRGREWEVATSCKRAPPLTGWERASVDVVHELLLAHARRYYYMYWPRGLPEKPEELRHVLLLGPPGVGKSLILSFFDHPSAPLFIGATTTPKTLVEYLA
ncbi:MAG: hypothetical protein QW706_08270, partial [Candidatus Nezhaarchaeales archaeon]